MISRNGHTRWALGICVALGLMAVSCADVKGPGDHAPPALSGLGRDEHTIAASATAGSQGSGSTTANLGAPLWFDISVEVDSTVLKPNALIEIEVTYAAVFPTAEAKLSVMLPEVEAAELSDWNEDFKVPVGVTLPLKLDSDGLFASGGQVKRSVKVTIPKSGIYRVVASAEAVVSGPEQAAAQPVVHETVWFVIHDQGGRVLDDFDPEAVPAGFLPQPGPFRDIRTGKPKQPEETPTKAARVAPDDCTPGWICATFVYFDMDLNEYVAVPGLGYEGGIVGGAPPGDDGVPPVRGFTDRNGQFEIGCTTLDGILWVTARFDNAAMRIESDAWSSYHWIGARECGRSVQTVLPSHQARTWVNAWYTIKNSRAVFGTRSKVKIHVATGYVDTSLHGRRTRCHWNPWTGTIRVERSNRGDCIWGGRGVFTFAHEYGHAVHEELGGGTAIITTACIGHGPGRDLETLPCAYNEGWADYHGLVTKPTAVFPEARIAPRPDFVESLFETNPYFPPGYDGSLDEGPVMAFFYDLFDAGTNEAHDRLNLRELDVLAVMGTCKVLVDGEWIRPTGIDHLIWCLESRVDSRITSGRDYFTRRAVHPTHENQGDHSWDETHIRPLWLLNLYKVEG